jgi:hypothetical protein
MQQQLTTFSVLFFVSVMTLTTSAWADSIDSYLTVNKLKGTNNGVFIDYLL